MVRLDVASGEENIRAEGIEVQRRAVLREVWCQQSGAVVLIYVWHRKTPVCRVARGFISGPEYNELRDNNNVLQSTGCNTIFYSVTTELTFYTKTRL